MVVGYFLLGLLQEEGYTESTADPNQLYSEVSIHPSLSYTMTCNHCYAVIHLLAALLRYCFPRIFPSFLLLFLLSFPLPYCIYIHDVYLPCSQCCSLPLILIISTLVPFPLHHYSYPLHYPFPPPLPMQFDFTKQDVPERDPSQVAQDMKETKEILASIKHELVRTRDPL